MLQLGDRNLHQFAAGELRLHGEAGNESNAIAHSDEALDGFEAGQLDAHVERGLVPFEGFDDAAAQWRDDIVRDEILLLQIADGDLASVLPGMVRDSR